MRSWRGRRMRSWRSSRPAPAIGAIEASPRRSLAAHPPGGRMRSRYPQPGIGSVCSPCGPLPGAPISRGSRAALPPGGVLG
jgi:hypothetical protein